MIWRQLFHVAAVTIGVLLPGLIPHVAIAQEKPVRHVVMFATTDYSRHENLQDLHDTIREAREFAKEAASHQAVRTVVHPVMENTPEAALYCQLEKVLSELQDRDELIVYVTGHGFEIAGKPEDGPFVATVDARDKWLDTRSLIRALGTRSGPRKLLILDACRELVQDSVIGKNGTADFGEWRLKPHGKAPRNHGGMESRTRADEMRMCQYNLVVIQACESGGRSLIAGGRSLFSKHLSDCLKVRSREKATLEMVFNDVRHRTKTDSAKLARGSVQVPVMDGYFGDQSGFERQWIISNVALLDPTRNRPGARKKPGESPADTGEEKESPGNRRLRLLNEETRKLLQEKIADPLLRDGEKKVRKEGLGGVGDLLENLRK